MIFLLDGQTFQIITLTITIIIFVIFCALITWLIIYLYKKNKISISKGQFDIDIIKDHIKENNKNNGKVRKAIKITGKILSWLVFGFVLASFGLSLVSRFSSNNFLFGNTSYIVIASGSMETINPENEYLKDNNLNNQIKTYDMVEIQKVNNKNDIQLYDVIAFKANDNRTIVHRVIEILPDGSFITKGDANENNDANNLYGDSLQFSNVVGRYTNKRIPVIGMFVIFLQSNIGILTIISIAYCLFVFDHYHGKYKDQIFNRTNLLDKSLKLEDNEINEYEITYQDVIFTFKEGQLKIKDDSKHNYDLDDYDREIKFSYQDENGNMLVQNKKMLIEKNDVKTCNYKKK